MQSDDELLIRILAQHHVPCPVCGYDLHCQTVPRCSECGRALALKVVAADGGRMRWAWVGALAAAGLNAGLGLFMLALFLSSLDRMSSRNYNPRSELLPAGWLFDLVYYAEMASIPAPLAILLLRRSYLSWPRWVQIPLALAAAALGALTFCGMATHLR